MKHQEALPIKLRYESFTDKETRYVVMLGDDVRVMRVYVDNLTRRVMISSGFQDIPSHVVPVEAIMTTEPDTSERGDRTGLRVKGSALAYEVLSDLPLLLLALASDATIGHVVSINDIPVVTDDALEEFLKD